MVELLGSYCNQDNVTVLQAVLAGSGRDQPPARPTRPRQQQHRLGPDEARELLVAYEAQASIDELAELFGINRSTVFAILEREGARQRRVGIIDRNFAEARRLYERGWSTVTIAQHFGVTAETVRRHLLNAGITMRRPWERRPSRNDG